MFIQHLTNAPFHDPSLPPAELRGDNQGTLAFAMSPVFYQRTKHIDIRQRSISDMVNAGTITVRYVHTAEMLAASFTKPLPKERYMIQEESQGYLVIG